MSDTGAAIFTSLHFTLVPRFRNLGTSLKWVGSFTPSKLYFLMNESPVAIVKENGRTEVKMFYLTGIRNPDPHDPLSRPG
jgi:hypothetical protein